MYGLKPVPFMLKPVAFTLMPVPFQGLGVDWLRTQGGIGPIY
jgi:hypothetical protein